MLNQVDTGKKTRVLDTPVFGRGDSAAPGRVATYAAATILKRAHETPAYEPVILFIIHDFVERVVLAEKLSAVVGRPDMKTGFLPDIDLTRYSAQAHGVSRAHARLHRRGAQVYITDLCSDNGTFIAGRRLIPDAPYVLGSGDQLALGNLKVRVLFPS